MIGESLETREPVKQDLDQNEEKRINVRSVKEFDWMVGREGEKQGLSIKF